MVEARVTNLEQQLQAVTQQLVQWGKWNSILESGVIPGSPTGEVMANYQQVSDYIGSNQGLANEIAVVKERLESCLITAEKAINDNTQGIAQNAATMQEALNQVQATIAQQTQQAATDREILRKVAEEGEAQVRRVYTTLAEAQEDGRALQESQNKTNEERFEQVRNFAIKTNSDIGELAQAVQVRVVQIEQLVGRLENIGNEDVQSIRRNLANNQGGTGTGFREKEISDYRSVNNLAMIPEEKASWNWWVDKFRSVIYKFGGGKGRTHWTQLTQKETLRRTLRNLLRRTNNGTIGLRKNTQVSMSVSSNRKSTLC